MKKALYLLYVLLLLFSCKTAKPELVSGLFEVRDNNMYRLLLNSDKTFEIIYYSSIEYSLGCKGMWTEKNGHLLLDCYEPQSIPEPTTGGYLHERSMELKIVNANKLQFTDKESLFKNIILQRKH